MPDHERVVIRDHVSRSALDAECRMQFDVQRELGEVRATLPAGSLAGSMKLLETQRTLLCGRALAIEALGGKMV